MAVTKQYILSLLEEAALHYEVHEQTGEPIVLFRSSSYVNQNGNNIIMVVIQLSENGEYIKFFLPSAYYITKDESSYAALKTFASISWQIKMVDFELDANDGEIRPTIDFPIEDGNITYKQILRCCQTIAQVIDGLDPFIRHAIMFGEVHEVLLNKDLIEVLGNKSNEDDNLHQTVDDLVTTLQDLRQALDEDESEPGEDEPEQKEGDSEDSSEDPDNPDYEWI
jgi:hypothetical protein